MSQNENDKNNKSRLLRIFSMIRDVISTPVKLAWLGLGWVLQQLFGKFDWQAPAWARWTQGRMQQAGTAIRQQPKRTALFALASLVLMTGSWYAYGWWQARPQPVEVTFKVTAPTRTEIEQEDPTARLPKSLEIHFDHSVAPLAASGEVLSEGISTSPTLAGVWRWSNEDTLTFTPAADWAIGAEYTVRFDARMFKPEVRLAEYQTVFRTPAFTASIVRAEFYQDPINPVTKQGVFELSFSHPVNTAELEKRIELQLSEQSGGVLGIGKETTAFSVSYDKFKLHAYVRSAVLAIPKENSSLGFTLDKGAVAVRDGPALDKPMTRRIAVPGLYSLRVTQATPLVANNDKNEPEQVLMISTNANVHEREMKKAVRAWVLPKTPLDEQGVPKPYESGDPVYNWPRKDITAQVLKQSRVLPLEQIPAEFEYTSEHNFRYNADVGAQIYVQIDGGIKSFGGYIMSKAVAHVLSVLAFPAEIKILSQGSLLAMSGDKKVAVLVRDVPGVKVEIGRILPAQLQHLVSQADGDFAHPHFYGRFGADNLTERFESKIPLLGLPQGKAHYEAIDLNQYLKGEGDARRGIFLLNISGYDPRAEERAKREKERNQRQLGEAQASDGDEADADSQDAGSTENYESKSDQRLVVVTDLGILVKKSIDGSQDVFVQSIYTGKPVEGASVEIIGKNGQTLFSQNTDASGRVHFAKIDGMSRERAPLMILVRKAGDLSFLPLNTADRSLDMSRFDVGGGKNASVPDQVSAYLFSDRGIYRPGDTFHIGMITKSANWSGAITGLPLEVEVTDARGLTVKREKIKLPAGGFSEISYATEESAATGTYSINLYLVRDGKAGAQIGSTTVKVQEFQPDRMKVNAKFTTPDGIASTEGWLHPRDLKVVVNAQNLFGTPAENRRVTADLILSPAFPAFKQYPDYRFYDPQRAKEGYTDQLGDQQTDQKGDSTFDLGLAKYAKATYRLQFLTRAYEPQGGRGVAAEVSALVSELPYLVGFKSDGALDFVSRGGQRNVSLLAIDPKAQRTAVTGLTLLHMERKYVSVLTRQIDGGYKYESRRKDILLKETPLVLPANGYNLALASDTPGNYAYVIRDAQGVEFNRIDYSVAGQGNVTRNLERNAELQLTLNKKDYLPGEEIEVSIRAPYIGAGLITIERDKVFTHQWFRSTTLASVQKIRLPKDFEGNGYISVQFIRDPSSDEIFMSPLSYGVVPFATSLASRTNKLSLTAPDLVKPGQTMRMKLTSSQPTRAVVFAVDEGILQVARYQTPDPLGFFFQKRMLEVRSSQILDLILPEFKRLMAISAPGGDGDGGIGKHLNPFKRKHDKPAVYWSGIVDVNGSKEFSYQVPDTFNGSMRIMAVAIDDKTIGTAQTKALVRGDFVISPNVPLAVAPGDEFDVTVGVSNNVAGSGKDAAVSLALKTSPHLAVIGGSGADGVQTLKIGESREGVATYRIKALDGAQTMLGSASLSFTASLGGKQSKLSTDVSVRPATARYTQVTAGNFTSSTEVQVKRSLYPQYRVLEAGVSSLPLVLSNGLSAYLANFPHLCTEQMISQAIPALISSKRPEFFKGPAALPAARSFTDAIKFLRTRQNAEGGFGLWTASIESDEFVSVYAAHLLLEAHEQGESVPADMLQKSMAYIQRLATSPGSGLPELRVRAYAAYLLTRQMVVTTPILSGIRESLEASYPKLWKSDLAAAYLAAAYQLQKQDKVAGALMDVQVEQLIKSGKEKTDPAFSAYYGTGIRNAQALYLLARHFPARVKNLPPAAMTTLVQPIVDGYYNTLSSAYLIMAFDAYASVADPAVLGKLGIAEINAAGKQTALSLPANLVPRVPFSADASKLRLSNDSSAQTYYSIVESGFDKAPLKEEMRAGLEVQREFLGADGKAVSSVNVGDEITVRLRVRTTARDYVPSVALIDLTPGGFEPVLDAGMTQENEAEEGDEVSPMAILSGGRATGALEYVDVREDRVVFYGTVGKDISEISYRIKATNSGRFLVPPAYAESMYERSVQARSAGGRIMTVTAPAKK
ncbi:alpha-2-macroglobulin [Herminiimonas sp. KBW02]|uniref:alpha-2-macroglobulin family protein n=1 Tax=Herminiimonas sp. KBW02 TaxID=2153363 RepID=UPI000F59BAF7|nr:alpha-2-macroglobulin [Herminiimonas sp. KBW02]RQO36440.1 alpha-2-macroglobulin [Herminiimonas sp. KBW02]